ncbi:25069_t:CDS:1, partial [Gigaspora rosea]
MIIQILTVYEVFECGILDFFQFKNSLSKIRDILLGVFKILIPRALLILYLDDSLHWDH